MKEELKRIIENNMGIPRKDAIKPVANPQLDPTDGPQATILRRNAEFDALPEPEKQEIAWRQGRKDPKLIEKAKKIVKALKGQQDVYVSYLAEQHNIYRGYLMNALNLANYIQVDQVGFPSIGFDYLYRFVPPLVCPHCKKELPKNFKKI